jgi:hypothetical protein
MCTARTDARTGSHAANIGFNADTTLFVAALVGGFVLTRFAALATSKPAASLKRDSNTDCHHYVH